VPGGRGGGLVPLQRYSVSVPMFGGLQMYNTDSISVSSLWFGNMEGLHYNYSQVLCQLDLSGSVMTRNQQNLICEQDTVK
jgi:hypothetical protein